METPPPPPPSAQASSVRHQNDDEEDEMPLLFMSDLPADFQRNAQLAALATFMGSDEDDESKEENDDKDAYPATGKRLSTRQRRSNRRSTSQQQPYVSRDGKKKAQADAKTKDATKELQLYLSLFNVSSR